MVKKKRIVIKDLTNKEIITEKEMRKVMGGYSRKYLIRATEAECNYQCKAHRSNSAVGAVVGF